MARLSQRLIFFGGQGSRSLFSPNVSLQLEKAVAESSILTLLLSSCHAALLSEFMTMRSSEPVPQWADLDEFFRTPNRLLKVPQIYWTNPIVQSVNLCLYQLLIQLHQHLHLDPSTALDVDSDLQSVPGIVGFCSGMLPAIVLASSRSVAEYVERGREMIRLAYWVGYRAAEVSREIAGVGEEEEEPWATISVTGLNKSEVTDLVDQCANPSVHLCTRFSSTAWSLSGPARIINDAGFLAQCTERARAVTCEPVHVHALYHGGDHGTVALQRVLRDVNQRTIVFPSLEDIRHDTRLWSAQDGSCISTESPPPSSATTTTSSKSLLDYTLRCILVERADLYTTWLNLAQWLRNSTVSSDSDHAQEREIMPIGPGSHALLLTVSRDVQLPVTKIVEPVWSDNARHHQDGFAIVGMSVNFPLASNKAEFWDMLEKGLNAVTEIPKTRFSVDDYTQTNNQHRRGENSRTMTARHGNFLPDPFAFDHNFFNISPRESKSMDPQQKLLLQGAVRALDDAGYVPNASPSFQSESMGCYIGVATSDYVQNLARDVDVYYSTGTLRAFLSGKISYAFGWTGPSITVDTACSSSLVAITQACRALQNGDCLTALVGGVNAITSPDMYLGLSRAYFLSPTGQCKPFDVTADGYSRAEGCGLFVIKRLSDAVLENDNIYGVIRGVEMNQCGTASSITHPHSETQTALFQKLLRNTGLNSSSIGVVEAHGTGTQVGDAVESSSIEKAFGGPPSSRPVFLTSVKANIGHAEAASGSAGLAKLLMMLKENRIPPQVGLKSLNPKLMGLASRNIRIATNGQEWLPSKHKVRRALLNNFGAAGSNAALILEEFQQFSHSRGSRRTTYNFNISAKSEVALQGFLRLYSEMLQRSPNISVEDLCYTVTARRQVYDYRASLVCRNTEELIEKLNRHPNPTYCTPGKRNPVVFVFSGQGGFYPGMGKQLLSTAPLFRETVRHCDSILSSLGYAEVMPVLEGTNSPDTAGESIMLSQIACFVVEYALGSLWLSWNVRPDLLIGHSLGEYVAMTMSEAISLKDALWLVAYRAELMTKTCQIDETTMLACNRSASDMTNLLKSQEHEFSHLTIACENSQTNSVVSGPSDQIETLSNHLTSQSIRCKKLDVPLGFHSAALDPILEPLRDFCNGIRFSDPKYPIGSCYYGRLMGCGDLTGAYIVKQVRGKVRFADLVSSLSSDHRLNTAAFIEVGPAPITLSLLRDRFSSQECLFLPSLKKEQHPWETLCSSLQALSLRVLPINWRGVFDSTGARIIDLPEYPFQQEKIHVPFHEPSNIGPYRDTSNSKDRPNVFHLLIEKVEAKSLDCSAVFKSNLKVLSSYIQGHVVGGSSLCPASIYHEMVLEASISDSIVQNDEILIVSDISFERPLLYRQESEKLPLYLTINHDGAPEQSSKSHTWRFNFTSGGKSALEGGVTHCFGSMSSCLISELQEYLARKAAHMNRQIRHLSTSHIVKNVFRKNVIYNMIFNRVVTYSQKYQALEELTVVEGVLEGFGVFRLPDEALDGTGILSPVLVDTLLHATGFIANTHIRLSEACICVQVERIRILYKDLCQRQKFSIYCSLLDHTEGTLLGEAFAMTQDGTVVASVEGMHFKKLNLNAFQAYLSRQNRQDTVPTKPVAIPNAQSPQLVAVHQSNGFKTTPRPITSAEIRQTVMDVISRICEQPTSLLAEDSKLSDLGFDSLMWLELSTSLGASFKNTSFNFETLNQEGTVRALQEYVITQQEINRLDGQSNSATKLERTAVKNTLSPARRSEYGDCYVPVDMVENHSSTSSASCEVLDKLIQIINDVCEIPEGQINSEMNLGSLGVDSLMFIQLRESLQQEFGKSLLPNDMGSESTVQDIARSLCSTPTTTLPSSPDTTVAGPLISTLENELFSKSILTHLQTGAGDLPPLILFHDGSGSIDMYKRLHGIGCNVIGIANPERKGTSHWAKSLTDMARLYASAIASSTTSRVVLGGWSFGGVLAHEIAQQLESRECSALGVILIDSPCPLNHEPLPQPVIDYILRPMSKSEPTSGASLGISIVKDQFSHHARFLSEYNSDHYIAKERRYIMLQSEETFETTHLCGVKYPWLEDDNARLGSISDWEEILGRKVTILEIPGNHFEPFKPSNVKIVSGKIQQAYRVVLQSTSDRLDHKGLSDV